MAEYKLSYTANEINEKLGKIDGLSEEIVDLSVFVTPQMFGAVGDGVTDDTEAFKECFKHTTIYIPVGTYIISDTIEVLNKTNIIGNTRESSTIQSVANIVFDCQGFAYFSNMQIKGNNSNIGIRFPQKYLRLSNIGFVSLNTGVISKDANTIMFNSFVGCRFYYVNYPFDFNSAEGYQTNTSIFFDCIFSHFKKAVSSQTLYNIVFDRCTFEDTSDEAILDVDSTASLLFKSCYIECQGTLFTDNWNIGTIVLRDTWIFRKKPFVTAREGNYTRHLLFDGCHIVNSLSKEETFNILMDGSGITLDICNCDTRINDTMADMVWISSQQIAEEYGIATNCIINHGMLTVDTLPRYNGGYHNE